jgi:hypothetical protein
MLTSANSVSFLNGEGAPLAFSSKRKSRDTGEINWRSR